MFDDNLEKEVQKRENDALNNENESLYNKLLKQLDERIKETKPRRQIKIKTQIEGVQKGEVFKEVEDGQGEFKSVDNKVKIIGNFREGVPHGRVIVIYFNNRSQVEEMFDGFYSCGTRNGKGVYVQKNGYVQTGDWKNGKRSGLGVLRMKTGEMQRGNWVDGVPKGRGIYIFKSGNKLVCEFDGGKPKDESQAQFVQRDGTKKEGKIVDGNFKEYVGVGDDD